MPDRPMTRLDFYLILSALILGAWWASLAWPVLLYTYQYDLAFALKPMGFSRIIHEPKLVAGAFRIGLRMLCIAIIPLTVLVPILKARRPRPASRSTFGQPGVAACIAASGVLLMEAAYYPLWLWTIVGEQTRLRGDIRSDIVSHSQMSEQASMFGSLACGLGEHPGLAVGGVFIALWISGIRLPGSGWIDRMGKALGVLWVVTAIGFLLIPYRY